MCFDDFDSCLFDLCYCISIFRPFIDAKHLFFSIFSLLRFLLFLHEGVGGKKIVIMCLVFIILDTGWYVILTMPFLHTWPTKFEFTLGTSHPGTTWIFLDAFSAIFVRTLLCVALNLDHVFIIPFDFFKPDCVVRTIQRGVVFF